VASGSRTYSRKIQGEVTSPANLYRLADNFGQIVKRYAPDAEVAYGTITIYGVTELSGTDILSQLTPEEREITPLTLNLTFADGPYRITLSDRMGARPIGFWLNIDGPDEVRVIGLAEKIRKDTDRLIQTIESGEPPPNGWARLLTPTMTQGRTGNMGPSPQVTGNSPAPTKTQMLPTSKSFVGNSVSNGMAQERRRSGLVRFVENPYTIATTTGLIVWVVTNLPSVTHAVSSWWSTLVAQPWFAQSASIVVSVLAGIASAFLTTFIQRRRKA
jgi:hypothetical protein